MTAFLVVLAMTAFPVVLATIRIYSRLAEQQVQVRTRSSTQVELIFCRYVHLQVGVSTCTVREQV